MEKLKKKLGPMALCALFALNIGYYFDLAYSPVWNQIYAYYADAPSAILDYVATGPQFFIFLGAVFCAWLVTRASKKTVLIFCSGLFCVTGLIMGVVDNVYYLAVMRSISGFSIGGMAPTSIALIVEFNRDDERKCNTLTGVYNGVGAVIGGLIALIAGILCVSAWKNVFGMYWISVLMLALVIIFVPHTPAEKSQIEQGDLATAPEKWSKWPMIATLASMFVISIFYMISVVGISFFVDENGLGDASLAGLYSSLATFAGAIGAFMYPMIERKIKRATPILFYSCEAVGFLLLFITNNLITPGLAVCLCGYAYSMSMTYYMMYVTKVVPPSHVSSSINLVTAALSIGSFLSAYAFTGMMIVAGTDLHSQVMPYVGVICLVCIALAIILTISAKKKASAATEKAPIAAEKE
ncbi:MAG: MFS transporter [Coriobacteriales bacterium]|jgi:MFS family permease